MSVAGYQVILSDSDAPGFTRAELSNSQAWKVQSHVLLLVTRCANQCDIVDTERVRTALLHAILNPVQLQKHR